MTTQVTGGGEIITFSPRFTITDMTGTWSSTFTVTATAASAEISTTGTLSVTATASDSSTGTYSETGPYAVTYTLQTGATRYAPMPRRPGSTITATNTDPQYPTSSVSIATTYLGTPKQVMTVTDAINYSVESHANTVSYTYNCYRPAFTDNPIRPLQHLNPPTTTPSSWLDGRIKRISYNDRSAEYPRPHEKIRMYGQKVLFSARDMPLDKNVKRVSFHVFLSWS